MQERFELPLFSEETRLKKEKNLALDRRIAQVLYHLGLPEDELRGKKVADIGAGRRELAAYCLRENISKEVYSIEPNLDHPKFELKRYIDRTWPELAADLDAKTIKGDSESLPFANDTFDIAVNHAALPSFRNLLIAGKTDEVRARLKKFFEEITRVLKPGGKAYIYPIEHSLGEEIFKLRTDFILEIGEELMRNGYGVKTEKVPQKRLDPKSGERVSYFMTRMIVTKPVE